MKKQVALLMFMFLFFNSFGQNLSDQATVLQKCVDLPEIQNYLPLDADGTQAAICIIQHAATFPGDLAEVCFDFHCKVRSAKVLLVPVIGKIAAAFIYLFFNP